ncbi:MAG: tRNA(Ile)-lysidine synthase [Candidatus Paceibacteria bacterium]
MLPAFYRYLCNIITRIEVLITAFNTHIVSQFPALADQKILVACSGGLDSMVLLHLFKSLGFTIGVAHCNFTLRKEESDNDLAFVAATALQLKTPIFTKVFQTKNYAKEQGLSTQVAARELRYTWFNSIADTHGYDLIATGHHADDDLETFFINLSRGTGLRGLSGIPEQNQRVIRPLLPFSSAQILEFAKKQGLFWREDSSNQKRDYLRNKLRLDVLPAFKEVNKTVLLNFKQTQQHLKDSEALLEDYITLVTKLVVTQQDTGFEIDIHQLEALPNTKALLFELLYPFGFTDFKAISTLLESEVGKKVLSKEYVLFKDRNLLVVRQKNIKRDDHVYFINLEQVKSTVPLALTFTPVNKVGVFDSTILYVDAAKLAYPLKIRAWGAGDIFQPFGMKGKKKLSKFFKDEKLSLTAKECIWVLESGTDIVWLIGLRADDRFKVTGTTQEVLKIEWNK